MITAAIFIETLVFIYIATCVAYITLFSVAARFYHPISLQETAHHHKFLVLIPGYKEDKVIQESVASVISQQYPGECYHVMVISDRMSEETNEAIRRQGVEVLSIQPQESSKAIALQSAIQSIQANKPSYDYVIIIDADNIVAPDYLKKVNNYTQQSHCRALQTHRTAKNLNTSMAILDGAIEEMNNTIFRKGHVSIGYSSALIGSGMVFEYKWFAENIFLTHSAGEDKELEEMLLRKKINIHYADHIIVQDEKIQRKEALGNQRKRWIATQFFLAKLMWKNVPQAIMQRNTDYMIKAIQSIILPRSILMTFTFICCLLSSILPILSCIKWWSMLIILLIALYTAIPKSYLNKKLYQAFKEIPFFIYTMIVNLFRSKGASKKFIHTTHGN